MKFLKSPESFSHEFGRLIKHYRYLDWAVAWATNRHKSFDLLLKNRRKIRRIVVGTQFHQTAPEFIDAFKSVSEVRFRIDQEGLNGVFHPKLYLFSNSETDWEVVIGSANFTSGAFNKNTEHAVLISSAEKPDGLSYAQLIEEIEQLWQKGRHFTSTELEAYRLRWAQNRRLLDRVAGHDNRAKRKGSIYERKLLSQPWSEFYQSILDKNDPHFEDRVTILRQTQKIWANEPSFAKLTPEDRKKIGGTASEKEFKWRLFGSMRGAFKFTTALSEANPELLASMDLIPLTGEVRSNDYQAYIKKLSGAFDQVKAFSGLAVATRLICLRRPDYFVCVDSKNREGLFKTLGIDGNEVTVDTYWDTVVAPLIDTPWWQSSRPSNHSIEQTVWDSRVAMLDSLFYEEGDETDIDTVVVPMHHDGFEENFIDENRWYQIRIHRTMRDKIKYIAAYQVGPVSAITHYAEVKDIKPWKKTSKFVLNFTDQRAQEIGPIKLVPKSSVIALRGPRYTSLQKLLVAKNLDQAF